jgi:methionyl-tRNA formyltransferase
MSVQQKIRFVFFGTPELAVIVLDELAAAGFLPALIVTAPDKPQGRGLSMTPPPVKHWAQERNIETLQPERLDDAFCSLLQAQSLKLEATVFIVVAYGKILPKALLDIPSRGVLNVHPSLLPKFRGPSPVRSAIRADERETGVTVMLLDEKMDHGPIIAQKKVAATEWPPHAEVFEKELVREGGNMLASMLPQWLTHDIESHPQNDDFATYCTMIKKEDGLLDLEADPYHNLLKIRAYEGWPGTYIFIQKGSKQIRVKILDAHLAEGHLIFDRVIPEGKREMQWSECIQSHS